MPGPLSSFVKSFKHLPKELFRINNGRVTKLRGRSAKRTKTFDIVSESGLVKPGDMDSSHPNNASMRPNTDGSCDVLKDFKGKKVIVYSLPQGTAVPDDLTLVHEKDDHYLLQPAVEMIVDELNARITQFLESNGTIYTREQWLKSYRSSLESEAASPATTAKGRERGKEE